jgi:hypothetical protein
MAVVKNKSTERSREFWSHVESIAQQSRTNDSTLRSQRSSLTTDQFKHPDRETSSSSVTETASEGTE